MDQAIKGEFRRQLGEAFAQIAASNPRIDSGGIETCRKVPDIIKGVVGRKIKAGVPTYIEKDELSQECLIQLWAVIRDYPGGTGLRSYLKKAIENDLNTLLKKQKRQPVNLRVKSGKFSYSIGNSESRDIRLDMGFTPVNQEAYFGSLQENTAAYSRGESVRHEADGKDRLVQRLRMARRLLLTKEQQQVVTLCHADGLTQEEAATALGISRNAVKSRLAKAMATLRDNMPEKKISGKRYQFSKSGSLSRVEGGIRPLFIFPVVHKASAVAFDPRQ